MNVTKKVFVLTLVFGMFILFTSEALAINVLYAPLMDLNYYSTTVSTTTVYVGESLHFSQCKFDPSPSPPPNSSPPLVIGKVGNALSFNGKEYITVPNNASLNLGKDDFAINFWVKTTATKAYNTIIEKRKSSQLPGYHVVLYKGIPLLHLHDNNGWFNYFGKTTVNDGKWHNVAICVERNNAAGGKMYVDGVCVYTFNPTNRNGSLNNEADLLIGKHIEWNHAYFEGTLDEVWIFRGPR